MKITVAVITPQDYEKFNAVGMNAEACLADRVKLICQDDAGHVAESFMKQDEFDRRITVLTFLRDKMDLELFKEALRNSSYIPSEELTAL